MKRIHFGLGAAAALLLLMAGVFPALAQQALPDNDQTLHAMQDEMARSKARLQLPGLDKPYYIEYRLLDLDIRSVTASFGALVSSTATRNRFMSVDVRVGTYQLDSSNFISQGGFQGFLGSTGEVGIDRDYNSLRQDLWLATDQAYKQALTQLSQKQSFLRRLAKAPEIADFSQAPAVTLVEPRPEPDWSSRNWEEEARKASEPLRSFPDLYGTRVRYRLIYLTYYLMNSEGTEIRVSRSLAAVEVSLNTQADDGMPLHNFYSVYVQKPSDLPSPGDISKALIKASQQLEALRAAPLVPDYEGPVLFDSSAAGSLLAQALEPSLSGARPPLSMVPAFDEIMQRVGGRSDWSGRVGTRVLPPNVTLIDDPTAQEFQGQPLLGSYAVDDEGVRAQKVTLVENGILKDLLMSRRPGPEFDHSNGHARSALLSTPQPDSSNLFFQSSAGVSPSDLRQKFLRLCRDDGHEWCLEVKRMDNPALSAQSQEDFSDLISSLAGGLASGDRLPLLAYRVYVADGREELVRGGRIEGLELKDLRNMAAIGNDYTVFNFMQNPATGFAGTALATFGEAEGGIPSSIVAPSILLEDVEIRGYHGEPRRLPLVSPPPLQ